MRLAAFLILCLTTGCLSRNVADRVGAAGWFRADLVPAKTDKYHQRFAAIDLADPNYPCGELFTRVRDATSPIIVLVPGIGGDGPETEAALATLMETPPASIFLYRWLIYEERDEIAERLANGISRIAECLPSSEGRLLVIAHSAGGVLASYAISRLQLPPATRDRPWVTLLTVAAPLAGKMHFVENSGARSKTMFMLDLGTRITQYAPAARGAQVVHLRTHAPADSMMEPDGDLSPNDPTIGIPGAPQIDLPAGLDHPGALQYVISRVAADRWTTWRDAVP